MGSFVHYVTIHYLPYVYLFYFLSLRVFPAWLLEFHVRWLLSPDGSMLLAKDVPGGLVLSSSLPGNSSSWQEHLITPRRDIFRNTFLVPSKSSWKRYIYEKCMAFQIFAPKQTYFLTPFFMNFLKSSHLYLYQEFILIATIEIQHLHSFKISNFYPL